MKQMNRRILIDDAEIVNEGTIHRGSVLVEDGLIADVFTIGQIPDNLKRSPDIMLIDAAGKYLLPGVIDDHVHFREPGLTWKGDLQSESRAAVAGGITSFMEMPNTDPKTVTVDLLEQKADLASQKSLANYSFFLGATNDNIAELEKTDPATVCGVKVFMGASTGNMLVDDENVLAKIFRQSKLLVAVHCEDEETIRQNLQTFRERYGEDIPVSAHWLIRSEEACLIASRKAFSLAKKYGTRLHILHLSTSKELELLDDPRPLGEKSITGEVCIHHLWFDERDYALLGSRIKWNPAVKTENDKHGLLQGLLDGKIDIVATDHAPHTLDEKQRPYLKCPSGGPLIQHSLTAMFELHKQGKIPLHTIVTKMCHNPATLYRIKKRGFIRKGYYADLVIVDPESSWKVERSNILYKCGWSPFEGQTFSSRITQTFVNGRLVYDNGEFDESVRGMRLEFSW